MVAISSHIASAPARTRSRAAQIAFRLAAGPLFLVVAAALSLAESDTLRGWGWDALDHHGVPWPSSLALTSLGALQAVSFAVTGAALVVLARGLRTRLPRRRSTSVAAGALALAGAGLALAALPLDHLTGDPAELAAWVGSWHAVVHVAGFAAAALGGVVALVATAVAARSVSTRLARVSALVAVASTVALALPGALGWYAFLIGFFGWTAMLSLCERGR